MLLDDNIQNETQKVELSDKEIFIKIWTQPKVVFKFLNDTNFDKYTYILLILAGITSAFDRSSTKNLGDSLSLPAVLALCIILGGFLGWISYYLFAALLSWTGKWLQGKGNTDSLVRMLSYASIPSIASIVLIIPQIIFFGNGIFKSDIDIYGGGYTSTIVYYVSAIIEFVLGIWYIVLVVIGISEVQKLTIGKSILNMLLPILIILVPIGIIVFLIKVA